MSVFLRGNRKLLRGRFWPHVFLIISPNLKPFCICLIFWSNINKDEQPCVLYKLLDNSQMLLSLLYQWEEKNIDTVVIKSCWWIYVTAFYEKWRCNIMSNRNFLPGYFYFFKIDFTFCCCCCLRNSYVCTNAFWTSPPSILFALIPPPFSLPLFLISSCIFF